MIVQLQIGNVLTPPFMKHANYFSVISLIWILELVTKIPKEYFSFFDIYLFCVIFHCN